MAINLENLGIFAKIAPAQGEDGTQVVNLTKNDRISSGGKYRVGNLFGRWFRSAESRADNNAARTKLLQALGTTLGVGGMSEDAGVVSFDDQFLANLRGKLDGDPDNVLGFNDFNIKDGKVTSGRPLTERRVKQIVDRVRQLALNEMEKTDGPGVHPIPEFKRVSIATLQSEQSAQLIAATKVAARNRTDFLKAAYALTGRNEQNLSVREFRLFHDVVRAAFECCQGKGDAVRFDYALQVLNAMRLPGKDVLTAKALNDAVGGMLVNRVHRELEKLSLLEKFEFAGKRDNSEKLELLGKFGVHETDRWLSAIAKRGNAGLFSAILTGVIKPEHRKPFLAFCVRTFGADSENFFYAVRLLAPKFEKFADRIGNNPMSFKPSDAWMEVFGEPAPEGIDALRGEERTERFYKGFLNKLESALKKQDPDKYSDDNVLEKDTNVGITNILLFMEMAKTTFDLALAASVKNFEDVRLKDFSKYTLYNPEKAVEEGYGQVLEQFDRDFDRGGARITFGDVKIEIDSNRYRSHKEESRKKVVDAFNNFTIGMSDKQKLTIGFGLTQAGADIHGFIAGNGCASQMTHELRKNDDGSVMLKIIFPEYNGAKPISYTYRVDTEGNSRIVEFTYGDKKVAP